MHLLDSILHCKWEIFVSPGNGSGQIFLSFFELLQTCSLYYLYAFRNFEFAHKVPGLNGLNK